MKKIYSGFLSSDEYGGLKCGDKYLIDQMNVDWKKGDSVFLRYFLADKKMTEDKATKALIFKTIGGAIDALDFVLDAYSEYTILEYNEKAVIGGHDLLSELEHATGKFLLLIIEST